MRVKIDRSVFFEANDDAAQLELSFLLHIILYKQRYTLLLTDGGILSCGSYNKLMQSTQMVIQRTIEQSIVSSSNDPDCEIMIGGDKETSKRIFSPSEAILFLLQPLSIVLENGLNDSHFMKAIFRCFDPSKTLSRHEEEGWIRFENAGGCSNVKSFIKSRIGYLGDKTKFLRCYVLLDGDRRFPADTTPSIKYTQLKNQLTAWGVSYHILEKRSMENYLPDEAIMSFSNKENQQWLAAYQSLTPQEKDYYCIAEGFGKDIDKEARLRVKEKESRLLRKDIKLRKKSYVKDFLPVGEKNFYSSVSSGNFLHLESGLKVGNFKSRFPMKFDEIAFVYKSSMLKRTSHQSEPKELELIAKGVLSLI